MAKPRARRKQASRYSCSYKKGTVQSWQYLFKLKKFKLLFFVTPCYNGQTSEKRGEFVNTNTSLENFLKREDKKKKEKWEKHVFGLIKAGDPKIISFIEENYFSIPLDNITLSIRGAKEVMDLSVRIPVKLKRRLKTILLAHRPDVVSKLQSMCFSFNSKSFRGG